MNLPIIKCKICEYRGKDDLCESKMFSIKPSIKKKGGFFLYATYDCGFETGDDFGCIHGKAKK